MFRKFWCPYPYRTFSRSSLWRNLEKAKPEPEVQSSEKFIGQDLVPNEIEKRILLLSGKYKSRDEIPARVRIDTLNNAKSKLRIRLSNTLMGLTILVCIVAIYFGKQKRNEGNTIVKRIIDRDNELREEGRLKREKAN